MTCPCCGKDHGAAGIAPRTPGSFVEAFNVSICTSLPPGWVYVAQSFEHGPDGLIIDPMAPQSQRRRIDQDG